MSTLSYAAHDSGFLAQRKASPVGIGGAIAIHVGVVAVLLLMPGIRIIDKFPVSTLLTRNIPIAKPPPERIQPPKPKKIVLETNIYRPPSEVDFRIFDSGPTTVDTILPPPPPQYIPPLPKVETSVRKPLFVESRPDPRYARNLQPDYPPARLREEEEGKVTVRVRIGPDGRVLSVEQVSASHPDFWRAAREQALKAWRFLPATRDGVAVESERVMTVYFKMQNQ